MKKTSFYLIPLAIFLLLTNACLKKDQGVIADPEFTTSAFSAGKLKSNGCAIITGIWGSTSIVDGTALITYTISWNNPGGKKVIEVISADATSFFIDASKSAGRYTWSHPVENQYGLFSIRTITHTGSSKADGSVCQDKIWEIAIDPPA